MRVKIVLERITSGEGWKGKAPMIIFKIGWSFNGSSELLKDWDNG